MAVTDAQNPLLGETTCGSLLQKLQVDYLSYLDCQPVFTAHMYGLCIIMSSKLLHYLLQEIWDEVGESDEQRDKMLLQLEQDCLDEYKRKVEQAAKSRAQLLQALSYAKLELSTLLSALGEKSFVGIVSNY